MKSDRALRKWYRFINKKFFGSYLTEDVCVRWADENEEKEVKWEEKYFGWTTKEVSEGHDPRREWTIILSKVRTGYRGRCMPHSVILSTLAHEMVHVATKCKDDHGPVFEKWRQLISDKGFFKKNALVKNTTMF